MTGYCDGCGNTQCICAEIESPSHHLDQLSAEQITVSILQSDLSALRQRVAELEASANLLQTIGQWAHETFPEWSVGGIITHIRRELDELEANPTDGHEMADPIILLCHLAYEQGVNLSSAIYGKHRINQLRQWSPPDAQGVVEHVRE